MTPSDKQKIRDFMTEQFLFEFDDEITPRTNLFTTGIIDSFGFVELVAYLEAEFGIKFTDEELLSGRFNSFKSLVSIVKEKQALVY